MIDTLKLNYPDSQIDLLVNKRVIELVQDYPNINKVQSIEKESLRAIRNVCRTGEYDLAIIVHPSFRIALALFFCGIKYRLGTGYRWYSFLFNIKHYQHRKYSTKHELEYNLDLLNELGCVRSPDIVPKLSVIPELEKAVKDKLVQKGINPDKEFIIIHPSTLGSAKVWGQHNFVKLCNLLIDYNECNFNIILTGTSSDELDLNSMMNQLNPNSKVFVLTELNLKEFSALTKLSKLFISSSTGPIHIGAAVGTFVVGFYSPLRTESSVRWGPYTDRKKIFTPSLNTNEKDAMDDIKPEEVYSFIKDFMSK
jgi:ADP-heptose:LPS heptosyltransferase